MCGLHLRDDIRHIVRCPVFWTWLHIVDRMGVITGLLHLMLLKPCLKYEASFAILIIHTLRSAINKLRNDKTFYTTPNDDDKVHDLLTQFMDLHKYRHGSLKPAYNYSRGLRIVSPVATPEHSDESGEEKGAKTWDRFPNPPGWDIVDQMRKTAAALLPTPAEAAATRRRRFNF